MVASSRIRLRELDVSGRHELLANETGLDETTFRALLPEHGLTVEQADHMIENAVSVLGIPLDIACNFVINGRDVLVPMATEEPSVVAAASNAARIAQVRGGSSPPAPGRSCMRRFRWSTLPIHRRPGYGCWRRVPP
jgi:hydroxymethylglutaryl-CoA reductase